MIARAPQGEEAHNDEKQHEVDVHRQKAAREKEVVGKINKDVNQREISGPTFGNQEVAMGDKQVSAGEESQTDEAGGGKIEASGRGQHDESADHQEKERDVEVTLNGDGYVRGGAAGFDEEFRHGELLLLAKLQKKGSVGSNDRE